MARRAQLRTDGFRARRERALTAEALSARIEARTVPGEGCWGWAGFHLGTGYAGLQVGGRSVGVHRLVYEFQYGDVPDGHDVHHTCGNRACVRPDHLDALPHAIHSSLSARGHGRPRRTSA